MDTLQLMWTQVVYVSVMAVQQEVLKSALEVAVRVRVWAI
jgi:hypothetical protein